MNDAPEIFFYYLFFKRSTALKKTQMETSLQTIKTELAKAITDGRKAHDKKLKHALEKKLPEPEFSLSTKELEKFFKKTDGVNEAIPNALMLVGGEMGLPITFRPIVKAILKTVDEQSKSLEFVKRYYEGLQLYIRKEEPQILAARFTNCLFTKSIFEKGSLEVNKDNFIRILVTISRVFRLPYVIPEEYLGNNGFLPQNLLREIHKDPFSHGSLVSGHLSNWSLSLQVNRVINFEVTSVRTEYVNYFN